LIAGRSFDTSDRSTTPRVLMVNQAFVRRYYPDGRAIGRRLVVEWSDLTLAEIVGVVGDVRHNGLTSEPAPTVFLLHAQTPGYITSLVVRTTREPAAQVGAIRRAIQEVDRAQAVSSVRTMAQYVGDALARPRVYAALVACFAALALMLTLIGIYGLVAYVVNQRTHEIGIRLALGASAGKMFVEVFGEGVKLVAAGLISGVATASVLRRVIATFLFGVTSGDRPSYLVALLSISAVTLAVVAIPARRAARIEPASALRSD
jgi:ABC-type lipoprotein release transport system permease subunit